MMPEEFKLEPLDSYRLPEKLVEALYNYLGGQPAAQVEQMRAAIAQVVLEQQRAAARGDRRGGGLPQATHGAELGN